MADYFSRNFDGLSCAQSKQKSYLISVLGQKCIDLVSCGDEKWGLIASIHMQRELLQDLRALPGLQANDDMTKCLYEKNSKFFSFRTEEGIVYCKSIRNENWKLIIPIGLILLLCLSIHEQLGHAGSFKMHKYISRFFYWRYMRRDIKEFFA